MNLNFILRSLICLISVGISNNISAFDFKIDDIYYTIISEQPAEVEISGCSPSLKGEIYLPSEVSNNGIVYNTSKIGDGAFINNTLIENVIIPNSIIEIGKNAFTGCKNLSGLEIGSSVAVIGKSAFAQCSALVQVKIPNSVITIEEEAFNICTSLLIVEIGDGVEEIGKAAFRSCSSLEEVTLGNSITIIKDYSFDLCKSLKSITIPNSVIEVGNFAFNEGLSLCYVEIGENVSKIDRSAFIDCPISSAVINCRIIPDYFFDGKTNLESLVLGNAVKEIGKSAFRNCEALTKVVIPNSVTTIKDYAFQNCVGLSEVEIGEGLEDCGENIFKYCALRTAIVKCNSIPSLLFKECSFLNNLELGPLVKKIENGAFYDCTRLKTITCLSLNPPTSNNTEIFNDDIYSSCKLIVPRVSLDEYKSTNPWRKFLNVQGMEVDDAGVEKINTEISGTIGVYDLNGKKILKSENPQDLYQLPAGFYIINNKKVLIHK